MSSILDYLMRPIDPNSVDYGAPPRPPTVINQGTMPGPQRLTRKELQRIAQQSQPPIVVIDQDVEANCISIPFSLPTAGAAAAQLILPVNSTVRTFLNIRNSINSSGTLFVGLSNAADDANAAYALVAGAQLILDVRVPQNDIWLSCDTATTFGTLVYAIRNPS